MVGVNCFVPRVVCVQVFTKERKRVMIFTQKGRDFFAACGKEEMRVAVLYKTRQRKTMHSDANVAQVRLSHRTSQPRAR